MTVRRTRLGPVWSKHAPAIRTCAPCDFPGILGISAPLSAGLSRARGARVLLIDADLQDPPEALGPMLALMDAHHADVVYGRRLERAGESWFKKASARLFYRVLRWLSSTDIPADTGDFRLLSGRIVAHLNAMPEQQRYLRGMIAWLGGTQVPYDYRRESRGTGQTGVPAAPHVQFRRRRHHRFFHGPAAAVSGAGWAVDWAGAGAFWSTCWQAWWPGPRCAVGPVWR